VEQMPITVAGLRRGGPTLAWDATGPGLSGDGRVPSGGGRRAVGVGPGRSARRLAKQYVDDNGVAISSQVCPKVRRVRGIRAPALANVEGRSGPGPAERDRKD